MNGVMRVRNVWCPLGVAGQSRAELKEMAVVAGCSRLWALRHLAS